MVERSHAREHRAFRTRAFFISAAFLAALFPTPARAQEASADSRVVGIEGVDFTDRTAFGPFSGFRTTFEDERSLNVENTPRARNEGVEEGEDEIVVIAPIVENFSSTENSEFDDNFFDRMGVEATSDPDLEGLAFLTREEMRDNGWALNVPVLGSRRGQTGPFLSLGAGRPERIVAAGVRF